MIIRRFYKWGILALIALVVVLAIVLQTEKEGTVYGTVRDALSGDPIRGVTITLGPKSLTRYVSDTFKLTEIPSGAYTLKANAPSYYDYTEKITIKKGKNTLNIAMKGKEIPDLTGWIVWTELKDNGIELEIRFTDKKGHGITNFPCLPLTLEGKLYTRLGSKEPYKKGRKLFEGPIKLFWDSKAFLGKNKGLIPKEVLNIDPKTEKYGILELVLHTPNQGDLKKTIDDVDLVKEVKK